jgi:hypothetical protein
MPFQRPRTYKHLRGVYLLLLLCGTAWGASFTFKEPAVECSLSTADARERLAELMSGDKPICEQPGGLISDSVHLHPLERYGRILTQSNDSTVTAGVDTEELDSVALQQPEAVSTLTTPYENRDSLKAHLVKALCAFDRFKAVPSISRRYAFSHDHLLRLTSTKETPTELPWLMKLIDRAGRILYRYLWEPILNLLIRPLKALSWGLRLVVIIGGSMLVLAFLLLIARVIERVYPVIDSQLPTASGGSGIANRAVDWLQQARRHYGNQSLIEATDSLYRWLIGAFSGRRSIKRQEWWTNRQLLSLISTRIPERQKLAALIIAEYEAVVYGHQPPQPRDIEAIFSEIDGGGR